MLPHRQANSEACAGRRCDSHDTDHDRRGQDTHAPASASASASASESESASAVVEPKAAVVVVGDESAVGMVAQ